MLTFRRTSLRSGICVIRRTAICGNEGGHGNSPRHRLFRILAFLSLAQPGLASLSAAQTPPLPEGLDKPAEEESVDEKADQNSGLPTLPEGLGAPPAEEPVLPSGLGEPEAPSPPQAATAEPWFHDIFSGFVETRLGYRTKEDPFQEAASIAEARARLEADWSPTGATLRFSGDFVYDGVDEDRDIDLETGRGWFDLREANIVFRPLGFADVKLGRQILTWGTGDLIFINDLFPKDFRSFFIGRDEEYLKAPSDALRLSFFFDAVNLDIVYTPRFDADRFIDGTRLTFFNPARDDLVGRNAVLETRAPNDWFSDDEIAVRTYRNFGSFEIALYAYDGFWKAPAGFSASGRAVHPELRVWGASVRGPLMGGIANAELGYYDSRDDIEGDNPLIQNSEMRVLVGYEREVLPDLTIGVQYFLQRLSDYDALRRTWPDGQRVPERNHHTLTLRATKLAFNQNLILSLFNFWSPNEDDGYLRLRTSYKLTDDWLMEAGANFFYGPNEITFFGQLKTNDNVFAGIRRSF